ncbi:MAG TPA: hypothetical protein VIH61_07900 [Waddliaceae bacterium]
MTAEDNIELIAYERAEAIMVGLGLREAYWSLMAPLYSTRFFERTN